MRIASLAIGFDRERHGGSSGRSTGLSDGLEYCDQGVVRQSAMELRSPDRHLVVVGGSRWQQGEASGRQCQRSGPVPWPERPKPTGMTTAAEIGRKLPIGKWVHPAHFGRVTRIDPSITTVRTGSETRSLTRVS